MDETLLLRAIRENPNDDTLRLAYADCIEDEERRARIITQIADGSGCLISIQGGTAIYHRGFMRMLRCEQGWFLENLEMLRKELLMSIRFRGAVPYHRDGLFFWSEVRHDESRIAGAIFHKLVRPGFTSVNEAQIALSSAALRIVYDDS